MRGLGKVGTLRYLYLTYEITMEGLLESKAGVKNK